MKVNGVVLKEGKERVLLSRHPWIFSGALQNIPSCEKGAILPIYSSRKQFLGIGYFNPSCNLVGRVLSYEDIAIETIMRNKLIQAKKYREFLKVKRNTTGYRLINAEGDGLPGLIIDVYEDIFVMQISTYGMYRLKELITQLLIELFKPKGVYEKSDSNSRKLEGLSESDIGWLYGEERTQLQLTEHGIRYVLDLAKCQKTGFFFDQRNMRERIRNLSENLDVLNCFAYTGGFSFNALQGGAKEVVSVDSSESACSMMRTISVYHELKNHEIVHEDVFAFLSHTDRMFDLIILDPPAYAKKKQDLTKAFKHYKHLNELALKKLNPRGVLLTCSCSYFMDEASFKTMVFESLLTSSYTSAQIISEHLVAEDHPISMYHQEGRYLKSLLLFLS